MSYMRNATNDNVYRATIVVEQRLLKDDSVVQTWTAHSRAYNTTSAGATMWLNEQVRDLGDVEKRVRDEYRTDIYRTGKSKHKTYETLVEGTGVFVATGWTPKPKKGRK